MITHSNLSKVNKLRIKQMITHSNLSKVNKLRIKQMITHSNLSKVNKLRIKQMITHSNLSKVNKLRIKQMITHSNLSKVNKLRIKQMITHSNLSKVNKLRIKQMITHSNLSKVKTILPTSLQGNYRDSLGEFSSTSFGVSGAERVEPHVWRYSKRQRRITLGNLLLLNSENRRFQSKLDLYSSLERRRFNHISTPA